LCALVAMAVPPEGEVQPTAAGRKAEKAAEAEKSNDQVAEQETDTVATSESSEKKKEEPPKEPLPVLGNPPIVMLVFCIAILVAMIQQEDIMAGRPMDLFEPFVVAPPKASSNEVMIQFCQT